MKAWLKFGIPILVLVLAFFLLRRQFNVSVPVAPATTGTAVNAVTGTVEVLAHIDIRVKAQSRGEIIRNEVKAGDVVEAGDVISVQDSAQLDLQIEQVQIRLEASQARAELESLHKIDLESLDQELEGMELAVELKQAPQSRLDEVERNRRKKDIQWQLELIQEEESRKLLQNQLDQYQLQKEQMTTVAPFAGTVAEILAFKGDIVNGGQNLVRLISHGRWVRMELTEEDYYGVRNDQEVTLRLASYPDRTFTGKVFRLEDVANSGSKTRNLFVIVDAEESVLVPGLTGEGYLVKAERADSVLIPRRALIGNLVYVVDDGKVEVRRVRPGFLGLNQAEILEGIEAGELVVLEDQNLLQPGDRVEPVQREQR